MTSSTARPAADTSGLPPKVLMWSLCARAAAISEVVATAASGRPLPMPLAIVTISGMTPERSKPQKLSPVRPKPVCTSSAMQTPPWARTIS